MEQKTSVSFRGLRPSFLPPGEKPASGAARDLTAPQGHHRASASYSLDSQPAPLLRRTFE